METKGKFCAMYCSQRHGDHSVKLVKFRAKAYEAALAKAACIQSELAAQREKERKAAERRCGLPKATKALDAARAKQSEIQEQIAEAEAEGLHGIAIKLAVWRQYDDEHTSDEDDGVKTAYDALAKLIGVDYAAQAERW